MAVDDVVVALDEMLLVEVLGVGVDCRKGECPIWGFAHNSRETSHRRTLPIHHPTLMHILDTNLMPFVWYGTFQMRIISH